jgi:PAS domain S-box-containing protein
LPIYSLGSYLSGLLVILLIAFMYENEKNDFIESESAKSRALIESKRYIDRIIERFPLPTFVLDKEHRVIQWNRAYQQMTRVPAEEIIGRKVHSSLCIDDQSSLADLLIEDPDSIAERFSDAIVSETETGCFEMKMSLPALKKGSQAIISVAPLRDESGAIKGAIETIQNVGHLPGEADAAANYGSPMVELSSNPVFRVDSDGKISSWNKACEEAFGYSSSAMIGKSPLTFVAKSSRDAFREKILRVLRGRSFKRELWKYYTAEGEPAYVIAQAYPLQIMGGGPKRECVIVNTDITDITSKIHDLERTVAEAKEQLKSVTEEYTFLKKNLAPFIRKKGGRGLDRGFDSLQNELRAFHNELKGFDKT